MHFGKEREKAEGKANFSLKNTGKKEGMQVKWTEFGKFFPHPLLYLIQKSVQISLKVRACGVAIWRRLL